MSVAQIMFSGSEFLIAIEETRTSLKGTYISAKGEVALLTNMPNKSCVWKSTPEPHVILPLWRSYDQYQVAATLRTTVPWSVR